MDRTILAFYWGYLLSFDTTLIRMGKKVNIYSLPRIHEKKNKSPPDVSLEPNSLKSVLGIC